MNDLDFLSEDLILKLLNPKIKTTFILGATDTGKTTLIEKILEFLTDKFSVSIVDCDMGQSHIGPPTTVAWAKVDKKFCGWQNLKVEDFYFVGSLSPAENPQKVLDAVSYIYNRAKKSSSKIIIDTTGYISGTQAVEFKIKKINLILPDLILALEKENELDPILKNIKNIEVYKIKPHKETKSKSFEDRQRYRDSCFEIYFKDSCLVAFSESLFAKMNEDSDITNKIVSLQDNSGKDLALGIIREKKDDKIFVLTPYKDSKSVSKIIVGLCKWEKIFSLSSQA